MIKILPQFFTFKKPAAHSPYGPSSLERWHKDACPASVPMSEGIVLPRQAYSDEGELAHALSEAVYNKENYFQEIPAELIFKINQFGDRPDVKNPNVYSEMLQHAYTYVDLIQDWMSEEKIGKLLWHGLERGLPIIPEKNVYGTGDCVIIGTKAAVIIDFKYGRGKIVSGDSLQLLAYAVGVWRYLENLPRDYKFYSVVCQPRVSIAPKVAEADSHRIQQVYNEIWESVELSTKPGIQPVEGDHCFWCPAKRTTDPQRKCSLIKGRAEKIVRGDLAPLLRVLNGNVEVIDRAYENRRDEAARKVLAMKEFLIDTLENLEEEYRDRILGGENIIGLTVENEFGNREWNEKDPAVLENILRQRVPDVNPIKIEPAKSKLKTITEIEKESKIKDCLVGLTVRRSKKVLKVQDDAKINALSEMLRLTKETIV
jgi:hypothetical protein